MTDYNSESMARTIEQQKQRLSNQEAVIEDQRQRIAELEKALEVRGERIAELKKQVTPAVTKRCLYVYPPGHVMAGKQCRQLAFDHYPENHQESVCLRDPSTCSYHRPVWSSAIYLDGLDAIGQSLAFDYVDRLRLGMQRHGPWKDGEKLDPVEILEEVLDASIYAQRQLMELKKG